MPFSKHWKTGLAIDVELYRLEWDEWKVEAIKVEDEKDIYVDTYSFLESEHVTSMASSIKEDIDIKRNLGWKLRNVGYGATEFNDFVDCVHDALPDEFQAGRWSTPQAKLEAVWKGRDELDYAQVIKNLISNEIEDKIVGKLNGLAGEGLKNLTKRTGLVYIKPYF